jgi:hypothetical protein
MVLSNSLVTSRLLPSGVTARPLGLPLVLPTTGADGVCSMRLGTLTV